MTTQRTAAERLPRRVGPLAAAALLLSLPLLAQDRSHARPSDSSDSGRTAREVGSSPAPSAPSASNPPSGSSSPPRTAQPTGPGGNEARRQPPSRGDRDRGSRGHVGRGGYYYPYGYGHYGFWPGFWGWWWWDGYYAYPPYGRGEPYYYGRGNAGALDLDVYPARTEVYVDGQYVGRVDGFDGWPRYLWLPKGTYDLVFYLDGYQTIARQITVYPGSVIDIDDRLEPGESVRPEDLVSKSTERRDERLRYERERRERLERGEPGDDEEDWRDRVRRERGYRRDQYDEDDDEEVDVEEVGEESEEKGRLRLEVDPEDASVYLDGRFVGTGEDLARMRGGLPVEPGDHRLAIVRPGRRAEEREFAVEPGEEVELEIELESGR